MRIALIAPIIESVPPKKYGGSERIVKELADGLVKKGHDVTLFASGDSKVKANLVSVFPQSLREAGIDNRADGTSALSLLNVGYAYQQQHKFDIIHDHTHVLGLPIASLATTPTVLTLHDPIFDNYRPLLETLTKPYIVTISHSQGEIASKINNIGTVYNGLTMDHYPFNSKHQGYLLFFGTFRPQKGAHEAIKVAKKLGLPLIMAGKLDDWQMEYFNKEIKPHLSHTIRYVGEKNEKERNELMSKAICLLHPISWREPFGLVVIEAMACGAPVVAYDMGSSRELIKDGETGYVVKSFDEMVTAVKRIDNIARKACREHAVNNFNAERMVNGYEKIYRKILSERLVSIPHLKVREEVAPLSVRKFTFSPDFS